MDDHQRTGGTPKLPGWTRWTSLRSRMARSASGRGGSTSSSEGCAKHDVFFGIFGVIFIFKKIGALPGWYVPSIIWVCWFWVFLIKSILKLGALKSIPTEMKARPGRAASKFREHTRAKNLKERQKISMKQKAVRFDCKFVHPVLPFP